MNSSLVRHSLRLVLGTLAVLGISGCFPFERIWWAPGGDRAVVLLEGRMHLVGADGTRGEVLPEDFINEGTVVPHVAWLPDGSGFVCQRARQIPTWAELRALAPEHEAKAVDKMLPAVLPLLEAAAKLALEPTTLQGVVNSLPLTKKKDFGLAVLRLRETDKAKVDSLVSALPDGPKILASLEEEGTGFLLHELCLIKLEPKALKTAEPPVSLVRSMLSPLLLPKVSPRQDTLAFLRLDEDEESLDLEVLGLDGRPGFTVAEHVSAAFDWMPEGHALVFMSPIRQKEASVHSIHRTAVVNGAGALVKPQGPEATVTLATAATLNRPALQVLMDGRVLFSSHVLTLPAAATNADPEARLFTISTDGKTVLPVPTAPGDLPTDLAWFAASPDGKQVAVVESETDAVAVVAVDTGKTQLISAPHPRWRGRTMPAWKSATELTFAALHEKTPAWMLWSEAAGTHNLSSSWPATATEGWLQEDQEKTTPPDVIAKPQEKP